MDSDTELFIGPPPPAVVAEAESANEAERFEEVYNPIIIAQDHISVLSSRIKVKSDLMIGVWYFNYKVRFCLWNIERTLI